MLFLENAEHRQYRQAIGEWSLTDFYREQDRFAERVERWQLYGNERQQELAQERVTLLRQKSDRRYRDGLE